jgi:hypothetical protein
MSCFARNGTTLTIGLGFERTDVPDRYLFRLRAKRGMDESTADRSALKEIRDYLKIERYAAFQVEGRSFSPTTSYYEYIVQFSRS